MKFRQGENAMKRCFLGIDQGAAGSTALLIDEKWNVVATRNVEHTRIFPRSGSVEPPAVVMFGEILFTFSRLADVLFSQEKEEERA